MSTNTISIGQNNLTVSNLPIEESVIANPELSNNENVKLSSVVLKQPETIKKIDLKTKIIKKIDEFESNYIDTCMWLSPLGGLQKAIDGYIRKINEELSSPALAAFNKWLDSSNKKEKIIHSIALFLVKLPLKAARNILRLILGCFKVVGYALLHPVKALAKLAKLIVMFLDELRKPETWTKTGAGMIGAGLGQACFGNPLSILSVIIGGALAVTGFSVGALIATVKAYNDAKEQGSKEAWIAAKDAAVNNIQEQAEAFSESLMTGFLMGLIIGGIQKAIRDKDLANRQKAENERAANEKERAFEEEYNKLKKEYDARMTDYHANKEKTLTDLVNKLREKYKLPPGGVIIDADNNIHLKWDNVPKDGAVHKRFPDALHYYAGKDTWGHTHDLEMIIRPDGSSTLRSTEGHFYRGLLEKCKIDWVGRAKCSRIPIDKHYVSVLNYKTDLPLVDHPMKPAIMPPNATANILEKLKDVGVPQQVPGVIPIEDHVTPAVCSSIHETRKILRC